MHSGSKTERATGLILFAAAAAMSALQSDVNFKVVATRHSLLDHLKWSLLVLTSVQPAFITRPIFAAQSVVNLVNIFTLICLFTALLVDVIKALLKNPA